MHDKRLERDTMTSTMTIVDAALADHLSNQSRRHSRRDGSSTTTSSEAAISGTSGNIHIGHIKDLDVDGNDSEYSQSDYDERTDSYSEDGQAGDNVASGGNIACAYPSEMFLSSFGPC